MSELAREKRRAEGLSPKQAAAVKKNLVLARRARLAKIKRGEVAPANTAASRRNLILAREAKALKHAQRNNPAYAKVSVSHRPVDAFTLRLALHRMWSELAAEHR